MKKGVSFNWGEEQQTAFEALKLKLVDYPILAPPLLQGGGYVVDTDASNYAAGAVLQQMQEGQLRVIAYASRAFNKAERQYCTTRKELAAIIYALKQFRHYLAGGERFLLRTDHGALTSLFKVPVPISQEANYLNFLSQFNFDIQHRPGTQHGNSDGLSRRPCNKKRCTRPDCEETNLVVQIMRRMTTAKQVNHVRRFKALRSGGQYLKDFPQATVRRETQSSSLADRPKVSDRRPTPKREGGGLPVMKDRVNDKVKTAKQKWASRKPERKEKKGPQAKRALKAQPKVQRNPEAVDSEEITRSGNGMTWSMIVDEQNKCDDIRKVIELLPQKETLDNVDEWGMGVVQLWTQRKSLFMYKEVLHRHYVTPQ